MKFSLQLTEDEESAPTRDVSRHFEDTSYGYKDFSRHGMHVPTFRAQVTRMGAALRKLGVRSVCCVANTKPRNCCAVTYCPKDDKT